MVPYGHGRSRRRGWTDDGGRGNCTRGGDTKAVHCDYFAVAVGDADGDFRGRRKMFGGEKAGSVFRLRLFLEGH